MTNDRPSRADAGCTCEPNDAVEYHGHMPNCPVLTGPHDPRGTIVVIALPMVESPNGAVPEAGVVLGGYTHEDGEDRWLVRTQHGDEHEIVAGWACVIDDERLRELREQQQEIGGRTGCLYCGRTDEHGPMCPGDPDCKWSH